MHKRLSRLMSIPVVIVILSGLVACGGEATPTAIPTTAPPTATTAQAATEPTATTAQAAEQPTATTAEVAQPTATTAQAVATSAPNADATSTALAAQSIIQTPKPGQKVLKIWHYEPSDDAMGASWGDALKEFQAAHPDVAVDFELKTFDQIQQTGQMILNSSDVPDVMEINKGNATAGLYAKQGLLTDLTDISTQRGWDKIMKSSLEATARYDDRGIMGSGKLYGVTTYGEFVMVYYNKDMFDKYGLKVPTTFDEFQAVCDAFVKQGVTPISVGAAEWPITQNFYELALYKANRQFVTDYMTFAHDLDFHGPEFTFAAQTLVDQFKKGYYSPNATGVTNDDANAAFAQGKNPMVLTGSWQFGSFLSSIKNFQWGIFVLPGKTLNTGSGGNLLVVPQNAQNKDLAYDYLDLALGQKAQTVMANAGGIPINADLSQVTDQHIKDLNTAFNTIVQNDGLAFYPDWPAPGYMDTLRGGLQELITNKKSVSDFLDEIAGPWKEYKSSLP